MEAGKYNFALTLIRKIKDKRKLQGVLSKGQTLFHVLTSNRGDDLLLRVRVK